MSYSQQLRFGIVGGTNLTRDFHTMTEQYTLPDADAGLGDYHLNILYFSRNHSVIVGPSMEVMFPRNFSVEVDALHRNLHSTRVVTSDQKSALIRSNTDQFVSAKTWEFPVLLKYSLPGSRFRPFVEFGPSFRVWQETAAVEPSNYGATGGLGVNVDFGKLRFAPVVRYTRWAPEGRVPLRSTNPDQVELLGTFSYLTDSGSRRVRSHGIRLGLIGGTMGTSGFDVPKTDERGESRTYVAGLTVEAEIAPGFSVELNGLYRPLHALRTYRYVGMVSHDAFSVLTWEVPALAKYRFASRRITPFIEAGPALRFAGNTNGFSPSSFGGTVGAGVAWGKGLWRLEPVVRFTRWQADQAGPTSGAGTYLRTNPNELQVMLGLSF